MAGPLAGKTALVTGASGGIGAATAVRLAGMGATLVVHGRNADRTHATADMVRSAGGAAHVAIGSLSSDAEAAEVIATTRAAVGTIDILVNNAGGDSAQQGLARWFDASPADWLATYDSNVGSMVRLTHAFAPEMKERGWGRIILLSSGIVSFPMAQIPDYQGAKAAIRNMTRTLMKALIRSGVTVNCISPGFVLTETNTRWVRAMAKGKLDSEEWADIEAWAARKLVPCASGRLGRPEDIASAIAFLAHPENDFVNGVDIQIDGGG
ncbi:SDR family NAD(P)-dependent oxidoreductase [Flavisphingomonas formosensis]|uniref:SDR family NAD(P)-dependent oxidoreductase n=1 Tax=Flavisphingomonas formosensis TaxID=861534 RepID=UPI0012FAE25A|nr:SDR family oxidoreductase [Sphingomonas formosensis]